MEVLVVCHQRLSEVFTFQCHFSHLPFLGSWRRQRMKLADLQKTENGTKHIRHRWRMKLHLFAENGEWWKFSNIFLFYGRVQRMTKHSCLWIIELSVFAECREQPEVAAASTSGNSQEVNFKYIIPQSLQIWCSLNLPKYYPKNPSTSEMWTQMGPRWNTGIYVPILVAPLTATPPISSIIIERILPCIILYNYIVLCCILPVVVAASEK